MGPFTLVLTMIVLVVLFVCRFKCYLSLRSHAKDIAPSDRIALQNVLKPPAKVIVLGVGTVFLIAMLWFVAVDHRLLAMTATYVSAVGVFTGIFWWDRQRIKKWRQSSRLPKEVVNVAYEGKTLEALILTAAFLLFPLSFVGVLLDAIR